MQAYFLWQTFLMHFLTASGFILPTFFLQSSDVDTDKDGEMRYMGIIMKWSFVLILAPLLSFLIYALNPDSETAS